MWLKPSIAVLHPYTFFITLITYFYMRNRILAFHLLFALVININISKNTAMNLKGVSHFFNWYYSSRWIFQWYSDLLKWMRWNNFCSMMLCFYLLESRHNRLFSHLVSCLSPDSCWRLRLFPRAPKEGRKEWEGFRSDSRRHRAKRCQLHSMVSSSLVHERDLRREK